eukprot:TRINITY_DN2006_c0_g1_i1.p1 TRINITY_DN2006_c0_g1~~TRINITY_DN2006_c0_g1_i1.p1  ORF type:complete len:292 (-),score=81.93 TRINITY_DN2006_c0_g1_i1:336-1211(-)
MTNTVKVTNVSLRATKHDIEEFFSFSGEIERVEIQKETEHSQIAYVTFKDPQALDTALLLSGATIVDQSVGISPVEDQSVASAPPQLMEVSQDARTAESGNANAINKAQDVVSSMLAKGFVLGKDAMSKAKAFDEKHGLTASASAKVSSIDKKIGLSDKFSAGTTIVNEKVRDMDEKYKVSERTKSTFAAAEQKVNDAGSALMKNRYIFQGASWVTGAFSKVAKAAEDVGVKAKEKVFATEESKGLSNEGLSPAGPVHTAEPGSTHGSGDTAVDSSANSTGYSSLPQYKSG